MYLESVCIKHGSNEKIDINSNVISNTPNSIRITDRVLLGHEAKNEAPGQIYDIKNLLRIRDLCKDERRQHYEEHILLSLLIITKLNIIIKIKI